MCLGVERKTGASTSCFFFYSNQNQMDSKNIQCCLQHSSLLALWTS
uniref:Uncharacterized protein n=1 Tax=Rhizophora mucronata TaxID=61149 RepID=A0A2P2NBW2_RHIMU